MNNTLGTFLKRLQKLEAPHFIQSLASITRGFEKESLRVDKNGFLAVSPHPIALGSSLMHPKITTDYSEALLEFITSPASTIEAPFNELTDLHHYTYQVLGEELLWAGSMPCQLPAEEDIPIAQYGSSCLGRLKHIYRRGLGNRYGKSMQTIAGIHYNFSLPQLFWEYYQASQKSELSLQQFISEQYLGLMRNCLRFGWLLSVLFGASPAVSDSFFNGRKPNLAKLKSWDKETWIGPYATSLRLSDLGYHNRSQSSISISYNSFDEFLYTMRQAVHTPFPEYSQIGIQKAGEYQQLSDSLLQIEDEHYALIRPKRLSGREERTMAALVRQGIEYIELRALDINPFIPIGIETAAVPLLDTFLIMCLLMDSPPLTDAEMVQIEYNHMQAATQGREPLLQLRGEGGQPYTLTAWALEIIGAMEKVAVLLDKVYSLESFSKACDRAKQQILTPEKLPSARVLKDMMQRKESYLEFACRRSLAHQRYFTSKRRSSAKWKYYVKLAEDSKLAQLELECSEKMPFNEYLRRYLEG